ncbi:MULTISPECIES: MFS transporter [unclassified Kribbella]|uniref:MFS transporter n=1 Tax=unclassified Kribbella TaxID=2644121 RepID=UPI00301800D6
MPVGAFREVLGIPSIRWQLATSIVGRLNQGMAGFALLMLTTEHSTYAVFSAVSAAGVAGTFVAGPLLSRMADARGRRRVLAVTAVLYSLTMSAMALVPPHPILLVALSLLAGLFTPPMTATVRAALPALAGPDRRQTIFALESTLQELIFVLGPPTAALCAVIGGPRLAVGACAVLVLLGTLGYVRDANVDAGRLPGSRVAGRGALRSPGVPRVLIAGTLLVFAFSSEVIGVVAMVSGERATSRSGLVVAAGSLGSLVGGVVYGMRNRHRAQLRHLMLFVAIGLAALIVAPNPGVLTALLFCWGCTVAPAMSRLLERLSAKTPAESATEAFGWMSGGFAAGNALGTASSGLLVTAYGARAPIIAACVSTTLAALICERWPLLQRRSRSSTVREEIS